jgi:uncharacterized membrane-anchored protein
LQFSIYDQNMTSLAQPTARRRMLNKVPEVTLYFWVIKILCTTVGETASDYLQGTVGFGLTKTTLITASVLAVVLAVQFRLDRYVAAAYWLGVVLISVVGTQITDNLTDEHGVSLVTSTIAFATVLALVFAGWFAVERTLSIHTIFSRRREAFYWLAVLFTFALGTAAGDLTAERLAVGYWQSALMFASLIAIITIAHLRFGLGAITAFWLAYILTRPLGASIGDYLSQPRSDGGLGLGTTTTSLLFLSTILGVVAFLTITRADATESRAEDAVPRTADVLVVAEAPLAPALLRAVWDRAAAAPARFHLLLPNPARHAEFTDGERRRIHAEAEDTLARLLLQLDQAAGSATTGSVSSRHDAYDAIEETVRAGSFHEIMLAAPSSSSAEWLHASLAERIEHLGLKVNQIDTTSGVRQPPPFPQPTTADGA